MQGWFFIGYNPGRVWHARTAISHTVYGDLSQLDYSPFSVKINELPANIRVTYGFVLVFSLSFQSRGGDQEEEGDPYMLKLQTVYPIARPASTLHKVQILHARGSMRD